MRRFPLFVSLAYAGISAIWIAASDWLVAVLFKADVGLIQTYKGWLFIAATAVLLYWVLDQEWARRKRSEDVLSATVDELKRNEVALEDARKVAEAATAEKDRFVSGVTHDLRQPLQAIPLLTYTLSHKLTEKRDRDIIKGVEDCVMLMESLLRELRAASEKNGVPAIGKPSIFSVADVLGILLTLFGGQAEKKGLRLKIVPSRAIVATDAAILERILVNLLSNAIRYTEAGRVLVGCRRQGLFLRISVIDTGPGIAETELPRLFNGLHRGLPRAPESQGIGLEVVGALADAASLRVEVTSRLGKGSMFSVIIPLVKSVPSTLVQL